MKRIVILGAGFGGVEAAIELNKLLKKDAGYEVLVVSDDNFFQFTALLPQVASSFLNPRHIVQPVRDILRTGFRRDRVRAIDVAARQVDCAGGVLPYDHLTVALGGRTNYFGVPGAQENTHDFKTLEDAVILRDHVIDLCEHADHTGDPALRRRLLTFIVIGGGYTGVELLTELQDFLFHYVAPRYKGIPRSEIRLILLEATQDILRGVDPALAKHAAKRLKGEGLEVRRGAQVTRCFPGGVELKSGEKLEAETVVWAAGVRAHNLAETLPGPHDRIGRALVNGHLQLEGHPEVYVVGDSASAASAPEAPPVAPVAMMQGKVAARNIVHTERGEPLETYRYVDLGMIVTLGMNYAVLKAGPFRLRGYLAWVLGNAIHLFRLVGLKKQVQVALDWWLARIFPRDASIVRRPRGCRLCETSKNGTTDEH